MFLKAINIFDNNESFYKRCAQFSFSFICITSNQKWLNNKDSNIKYLCDNEFYEKIIKPYTHKNVTIDKNYLIYDVSVILESLPKDLQNIIFLSKDIIYSFKNYLNNEKLDKLVKD